MRKFLLLIPLALLIAACDSMHQRGVFNGPAATTAAPVEEKPAARRKAYPVRRVHPRPAQRAAPAILPAPEPETPPVAREPDPVPPPAVEMPPAPVRPKPGAARRAWDWFLRH